MKAIECAREQDVLDALVTERWPERADADLRRHVDDCAICSDLVAAVGPILDARESTPEDAHIPSSAVMWWRAQMRARQEAAREAARPITVAQIVGSASAVAAAIVLAIALFPLLRSSVLARAETLAIEWPTVDLPLAFLSQGWLIPALILGIWLVLTPLALYLAFADD